MTMEGDSEVRGNDNGNAIRLPTISDLLVKDNGSRNLASVK